MSPNRYAQMRYKKRFSGCNDKRYPPPRKLPWQYKIWLFLFFILAIVVGALAFIRMPGILVEVRLTVSDVTFDFLRKEGNPLFNDMWVKKARFVHFKKFVIPYVKAEAAQTFVEEEIPQGWTPIGTNGELTVIPMDYFSSIIFNDILFNELNLAKNAVVKLSLVKNEDLEVNIFIDKTSTNGKIDIKEEQLLESQSCQFLGLQYPSAGGVSYLRLSNEEQKKIDFLSSDKSLHLNLELNKNQGHGEELAEENIYIKNPSFVKQVGNDLMTSVVKPGKIIFKSMADKEIPIEPYDFVLIRHIRAIQVTRLEFQKEGFHLVLIGKINDLKMGTKEHITSKLPSILEWLTHKHLLILYLNIVAILIPGVIAAIIKLLK
jgi:hypothetical protein